jgi:hypothetical protein
MTEFKFERTEKLSPLKAQPVTEMKLYWGYYRLTFWVEGPMSKRMRRSACLTIYRAIRPLFALGNADIFHHDSSLMSQFMDFRRGTSLAQAPSLQTEAERKGAAILFQRLEKGWSQKELAARAGVNATHLSGIEHGRYRVRGSTLKKIENALKGLDLY